MKFRTLPQAAATLGLAFGFWPCQGFAGETWIAGWAPQCAQFVRDDQCTRPMETAALVRRTTEMPCTPPTETAALVPRPTEMSCSSPDQVTADNAPFKLVRPVHATFMADGRWRVEYGGKVYAVDDSLLGTVGNGDPLVVATVNAPASGRHVAQVRGTDRPKRDVPATSPLDHND